MQDVIELPGTVFSQQYLDLQKDFCCSSGTIKVIKRVGCKPGVYQGAKNLFSSGDLAMCNWAQAITKYSYTTIEIAPGGLFELSLTSTLFLFVKAEWPEKILETEKLIEIGLNKQAGIVGMTIPFYIENPAIPDYNYMVMKDIFHINTNDNLTSWFKINNISLHTVKISFFYAY